MDRLKTLLVQLPVPPPGMDPVEGNVPLAAACLMLFARRQGLDRLHDLELFPTRWANTLGDQGLIDAILARRPRVVSFSCYVWNVERTLWIAQQLKRRDPEMRVVVGGPEITPDNTWVLGQPAIDHAISGEGETAFAELLGRLADDRADALPDRVGPGVGQPFGLDAVSSPYREGILELDDRHRMLLETARGCRFGCKYCYYPKSNHVPRYLSAEQIADNLRYAVEHGAREVTLLDPTLNQRPDFCDFLRLLAQHNPQRQLAFSGELRAEGIDASTARLLRAANFQEVEIGLQSVEPQAWRLMGRPVDLPAFQRGVQALRDEGVKVLVDLIVGLPGDTVDSVRRGIDFLRTTHAYSEAQVFNLSILPGTAFRSEAKRLGLRYQPWPPYYVLKTPTLNVEQMYGLMEESQEAFGAEFDPMPPPRLEAFDAQAADGRGCRVDLDVLGQADHPTAVLPASPGLCFTLWLRSSDFRRDRNVAASLVERLLTDNPHLTLQVVLEPIGEPRRLTAETLELLLARCYQTITYLDRYYSLHPGRLLGAKRLFVRLSPEVREQADVEWLDRVSDLATLLESESVETARCPGRP
ncbi:MAG: radical SAM protein [Thermoguttaceae bacterium]